MLCIPRHKLLETMIAHCKFIKLVIIVKVDRCLLSECSNTVMSKLA